MDHVDCVESLDRLELHDEAICNEQIDGATANGMCFVGDGDRHLTLERNASKSELDADGVVVDRLEEARTELTVDLYGSGNDH